MCSSSQCPWHLGARRPSFRQTFLPGPSPERNPHLQLVIFGGALQRLVEHKLGFILTVMDSTLSSWYCVASRRGYASVTSLGSSCQLTRLRISNWTMPVGIKLKSFC